MIRIEKPPFFTFRRPWPVIATWFGSGLIVPASGTWGSLAALPFGVLLMTAGGMPALLTATIIVTILGFKAADDWEKKSGEHDSKHIVVDEVAGMWLTLLFAQLSIFSVLLAFLFFRVFDALKPWPICWIDKRMSGAKGVMLDDLLAALVAGLCVWGARYAGIG